MAAPQSLLSVCVQVLSYTCPKPYILWTKRKALSFTSVFHRNDLMTKVMLVNSNIAATFLSMFFFLSAAIWGYSEIQPLEQNPSHTHIKFYTKKNQPEFRMSTHTMMIPHYNLWCACSFMVWSNCIVVAFQMFRKLHNSFTDVMCNPFHNPGDPIQSKWVKHNCITFFLI